MADRQTQRALEQLGLYGNDTTLLKPKIEAIAQSRMQQRQDMPPLMEALRSVVDDGSEAEIKSALAALKAKQKEHKTELAALEKDLIGLLTLRQEAQLTVAGIINSDGGSRGLGRRVGREDGDRERRRGEGRERRAGRERRGDRERGDGQ